MCVCCALASSVRLRVAGCRRADIALAATSAAAAADAAGASFGKQRGRRLKSLAVRTRLDSSAAKIAPPEASCSGRISPELLAHSASSPVRPFERPTRPADLTVRPPAKRGAGKIMKFPRSTSGAGAAAAAARNLALALARTRAKVLASGGRAACDGATTGRGRGGSVAGRPAVTGHSPAPKRRGSAGLPAWGLRATKVTRRFEASAPRARAHACEPTNV